MPFWSQMVSPREPKIDQNPQKSCSRGLSESPFQKVTKNRSIWVPSRPQNIGFRAIGVSKIKKSPVSKNDLKMISKCLPFWMLLAPKITTNPKKQALKKTLKIGSKKYQKRAKNWLLFRTETAPKSQKSEPWAQNVPQASRRGPQAPKILKNHQKMSSKITQNYENLVTRNQENPRKKNFKKWHGGGLCAQRTG